MKKFIFIALAAAAAALSFSSCQKNEFVPAGGQATGENFTIYADFTKTTIDGLSTKWAASDDINVFHAEAEGTAYSSNSQFTISEEGLATGQFTGTLSGELAANNDWYALYPYSSYITTPANTSGYQNIGSSSKTVPEVQNGNNSTAHLAGQYFPLYAKVEDIAKTGKVTLPFKPALSIVKFHVTNSTGKALTVSSISLTAQENIFGAFIINFAGDTPTFADKYAVPTASLTVKDGEEIPVGESADFYLAIKPFTNEAGSTLTFNVNGQERTSTAAATFACGKVKTINFTYDKEEECKTLPYSESFANSFGSFTISSISGYESVWSVDTQYECAKATAYVSKVYNASESMLVSPKIDLRGEASAYVTFSHALNYISSDEPSDHIKLLVREYDGDSAGEWVEKGINTYPSGTGFVFVENITNLSSHINKVVQIALKYISTTSVAPTWEIQNLSITTAPVTTISFANSSVDMSVGDSPVSNPATSNSPGTITYSSSNNEVATVDASGNITAVANGTCTVTATVAASEPFPAASAICNVTVSKSSWVKTELSSLTSTDVFVIVSSKTTKDGTKHFALSNDKGASAPPTAIAVTIDSDKLTSKVASNMKWNISGKATDGYVFYPDGSTKTWLYCTNSNNGVRVGVGDAKNLTVTNGYLTAPTTKTRYIGVYNDQDWRCYDSYTGNIAGQTFSYYKYTTE